MFSFKSVYFVVFTLILQYARAKISDKRLCLDEKCSELIGVGKTLTRYSALEKHRLSFGPNQDVKIFSLGAGEVPDLWGVEIRGARGYVNKAHIKETHRRKSPTLLVDTERAKHKPEVPLQGEIEANPTQEPYEIVEGTKIPLDVAGLTTEPPSSSVDVVKGQQDVLLENTESSTKTLDSVPELQNNDQPVERPIVSIGVENVENKPQAKEYIEEEGDDDDDEESEDGDDGLDEDSGEDEEVISVQENVLPKKEDAKTENPRNISSSSDVAGIADNTSITSNSSLTDAKVDDGKETVTSEEANASSNIRESIQIDSSPELTTPKGAENVVLEEAAINLNQISDKAESVKIPEPQEVVGSVPKLTGKKDVAVESLVQTNGPYESVEEAVPSNSSQPFSDVKEPVTVLVEEAEDKTIENNENSQENSAHSSNISPPTEEPNITSLAEADTKGQTDDISIDLQNSTAEPGEAIENEANTEPNPSGNFAQPTTEPSTESEAYPPIDNDVVTPNPVDSQSEEQKPEDTASPIQRGFEERDTLGEIVEATEDSPESDDRLEEAPSNVFMTVLSFFGLGGGDSSGVSEADEEALDISKGNEKKHPWSSVVSSELVESCDVEKCPSQGFCDKESEDCPGGPQENVSHNKAFKSLDFENFQEIFIETFSSDMFLYLFTTSLSVIVMVFMWILLEKCRREGPLIARINKLEQQLLATKKENDALHEKASLFVEEKTQLVVETVPNEVVDELNLKLAQMAEQKQALEEQIQALEKELDTSTEVGIELNKIISEMLNSTEGSDILKESIEQTQKRVLEQQATIGTLNETLNLKETEIHELRLEMDVSEKKCAGLQEMLQKALAIEEEKNLENSALKSELGVYQDKCKKASAQEHVLKTEILELKKKNAEIQRVADTKIKEYNTLKETLNTLETVRNDKDAIKSFLDVSEIKAQLEQVKSENLKYSEQLVQEREINSSYSTQIQNLSREIAELREKYEKADKARVEIATKLDVLNNYFKEKEEQMQKEIAKYETLWAAKEGEATSTTERIRYMQEELKNCKAQNESLKQEIVNQEVDLKSQISMLEKKVHENWVTHRQAERKLEEARQEAALLRNRLTLRERALTEGRMQSPLHQNGELPVSPPPPPPPIDPTQSPPPLFNPRDHMTKSPPIAGMPPPPFLPPPLGATPFIPPPPLDGMMPPPLGDIGGMHPPPFIPGLPPGMFPGDHRPPPLGRMSSPPPVGGRYSPESTVYSEYDRYDRRSPSPPYDSEYGASPPPIMGYSPYSRDRERLRDDRREYKRPQPRSNGRNSKGIHSSGSENDSLGKVNKKPQRKV